jgi:hypothetical protein
LPPELALELTRIDRVAVVVPGPIGDEGDLVAIGTGIPRTVPVKQVADGADDIQIGPLGIDADG